MNVMTKSWAEIGKLEDVPPQGSRRVEIGALRIAIFRTIDDRIFALEDKCPHKAGPLSQGIIHDACVTCPLHNWVISLEDGTAQGADKGQVKRFETRVIDRVISLNLADLG